MTTPYMCERDIDAVWPESAHPFGQPPNSLGVSIGATNFVGVCGVRPAVIAPSTLTLYRNSPPEIGNLTRKRLRLSGFVDRVGDPVPLIASDGSVHRPEKLAAEALEAMSRAVTNGSGMSAIAATVPAHWSPIVIEALRSALRGHRRLCHHGAPLPLITDATAALAALQSQPGLPSHGVIVLCDFGGSGTSITLADASSRFTPIGAAVRFQDFSGDQIDFALMIHILAGLINAGKTDPVATTTSGSLARLRKQCRRAKERLSTVTATAIVAELSGGGSDIRVVRNEFEDLIREPLAGFMAVLHDTLERYAVDVERVSAVATIGGGARIPLVTQRLSEDLRAPVVTTPHPQLTAAEGAALIAHRLTAAEAPAGRTTSVGVAPPLAPSVSMVEPTMKTRALAWSEDNVTAASTIQPAADENSRERPNEARPALVFDNGDEKGEQKRARRRGPLLVLSYSAAAAVIAASFYGSTLFGRETATTSVDTTAPVATFASDAPDPPPTPLAPPAPQVETASVLPTQITVPARQRPRFQRAAPHQAPSNKPETPQPKTQRPDKPAGTDEPWHTTKRGTDTDTDTDSHPCETATDTEETGTGTTRTGGTQTTSDGTGSRTGATETDRDGTTGDTGGTEPDTATDTGSGATETDTATGTGGTEGAPETDTDGTGTGSGATETDNATGTGSTRSAPTIPTSPAIGG